MLYELHDILFGNYGDIPEVKMERAVGKVYAPKSMEGDYDLHIEKDSMTITRKGDAAKNGKSQCLKNTTWHFGDMLTEALDDLCGKKSQQVKTGDTVRTKTGDTYLDYEDWFVANKATPKQMMRWAKGALVFPGDIGKVVLMGEHLMYQDKMLALLDIDGAYYLVDADNLEVV